MKATFINSWLIVFWLALLWGFHSRGAEVISGPDKLKETHGAEMAKLYCQTCHLFPEPDLLDKNTWVGGALRRMAPLMGAARVNLDQRPDGAILKEAGIFPSTPLLSETDWRAIVEFYYQNAPTLPLPQPAQRAIGTNPPAFKAHPLRYPGASHITSMVRVDREGKRLFIGNAALPSLDILSSSGQLLSRVKTESAPVDIAIRPEGLYVTLIGNLFPSDERNGSLIRVTTTNGNTRVETILKELSRPVNTLLADLNGDQRTDLLLCSFGNYLGRLSWFEGTASGAFSERTLLEQPGAVNAVLDFTRGKREPDIYVLFAQAREGIHRFTPNAGGFSHEVIAEFQPAFGASHLEIVDFDGDGFPDLLVSNGDNGDYPSRFKNYHGIRIFLNDRKGHFSEKWFYAINGAFKAVAADFDRDGNMDIAAISFFPDYSKTPGESVVYFKNEGGMKFSPEAFPDDVALSGRWLTMDAGDLDGDGDTDLILGSFAEGPVSIPIPGPLQQRWQTNGFSVMWLENLQIQNAR